EDRRTARQALAVHYLSLVSIDSAELHLWSDGRMGAECAAGPYRPNARSVPTLGRDGDVRVGRAAVLDRRHLFELRQADAVAGRVVEAGVDAIRPLLGLLAELDAPPL